MCDSGRMRQCVTVGQWQSVAVCCSGSVTVLIYHKMILVLLRWLLLQDQSPRAHGCVPAVSGLCLMSRCPLCPLLRKQHESEEGESHRRHKHKKNKRSKEEKEASEDGAQEGEEQDTKE